MTEIRIGDQVIAHDRDATQLIYSKIERGDADECGCSYCKNFAAQRASAFPSSFRVLLEDLGVDPAKEGEVYECRPTSNNKHQYGGWFHLRGEIVNAGERNVRPPAAPDFEPTGEWASRPSPCEGLDCGAVVWKHHARCRDYEN